jgi:hypothetical protein
MAGDDGALSEAELSELAAYADGSLTPAQSERVAARVERSPELRALIAEQRAAITAVREIDVRAPDRMHARLRAAPTQAPPRPRHPRLALAGGLAAVAVAAATAVAVVLMGGGEAGPTVLEVAELGARDANEPPPSRAPGEPSLLAAGVDAVPFPDYAQKLGWRSAGARRDVVDGRVTETVFYKRGASRVAYTIVAGTRLSWPSGSQRVVRDATELRVVEDGRRTLVVWLRRGRTCVLSAEGIPRRELLGLAAWKGEGAVPF